MQIHCQINCKTIFQKLSWLLGLNTKIFSEMCGWEEEGGGARSLKGARRECEIPRDLARGARSRGGGEIPGTPD